jgi:hypothetical protein
MAVRWVPTLSLCVALMFVAGAPPARPPALGPRSLLMPRPEGASPCVDRGRSTIRAAATPAGVTYRPSPADDITFDAEGSVWRPDPSTYPVNVDGGAKVCWLGGAVLGSIAPDTTWEVAHDDNQPCLRLVASGWMVIDGLRCDNTGDGLRPRESVTGAQNVTMTIRGTYLTRIHDDCLENDGVIGGVLRDNLWDGCNTGISERPSERQGVFAQPAGESLVLDHMLIGLWRSPHEEGWGENALFKWSDSANELVIRCSILKVDEVSLNGPQAMEVPGRVDDRACPRRPSTLVWLGGGRYPAPIPPGMRVSSRLSVWTSAVARWRQLHGLGQPSRAIDGLPSAVP